MSTRRKFLQHATHGAMAWTALSLTGSAEGSAQAAPSVPPPVGDSDIGSLYPFVQSQAVKGEFPLSFLQPRFTDVPAWKREARGRLLDLLHYAPAPCEPRAETLERVDRGDYFQERVEFNTTPDIRVPAFVLIPKRARFPAPGIVALTTMAGSTSGARKSWSSRTTSIPSSPTSSGSTTAAEHRERARARGVRGGRDRHVLLGRAPHAPGRRRGGLAERPRSVTAERIAAFNRRSSEGEQLVGRTIFAAGFTWAGVMFWDDVRTVDYLLRRPEWIRAGSDAWACRWADCARSTWAALDDRSRRRWPWAGWRPSRAAQEQDQEHHRPHEAGSGPLP
jgi:hypothetical protein